MTENLLATAFEDNLYCDFSSSASKAIAGKDIILAIFDPTGADLWSVAGQQSLTINRSAESIEVTSKDTVGGWKSFIAGMKEWGIDNDGLYVSSAESHRALSLAYENSTLVCVKVLDMKRKIGLFGGLGAITDYPIEAPYDDAMTYSLSLSGNGPLIDLENQETPANQMPNQ